MYELKRLNIIKGRGVLFRETSHKHIYHTSNRAEWKIASQFTNYGPIETFGVLVLNVTVLGSALMLMMVNSHFGAQTGLIGPSDLQQ